MIEQVAQKLAALPGAELVRSDAVRSGVHLDLLVPAERLRDAAQILRDAEFMIESASGLDATPSMMVVYHFTRIDDFCRAALRVLVDRGNRVSPTIQDIYPGANWHERETHDFFGILFSGHPDMTPLILPEDAGDLCPLLKADEKALKDLGAILPRFAPPASAEEGSEKAPAKEKKKPEVDA